MTLLSLWEIQSQDSSKNDIVSGTCVSGAALHMAAHFKKTAKTSGENA